MTADLHQQVGQHTAEIGALKEDVAEMKQDVKQILAFMNQAQGSWKTLVAVGAFAAAIGGAVGWLLHLFGFGK